MRGIDDAFRVYADLLERPDYSGYDPSMAVTHITHANPDGKYLTVLFPPWHGGGAVYDYLTRRLIGQGSAVLSYDFHDHILEPNVERTLASFAIAGESVAQDVEDQISERGYEAVDFIAASLGNVSLGLVASAYPKFRKATMVVAASELAKSMWEGSRTRTLRRALENQGISEEELVEAWAPLAPINHLDAFRGKDVAMHVSTSDTVVPSHYQAEMVNAVAGVSDRLTVRHNRNGHIASVMDFCIRGRL